MAFVIAAPVTSRRARAPLKQPRRLRDARSRAPMRVPPARLAGAARACATAGTAASLKGFLADAEDLGTIRFVAISNGAVLETIGRFDYGINEFSVPGKGDYVTLASIDKTFECHINTSKVASISLGKEPAKIGGHDLFVVRFKDSDGGLVLSCLLMWDPSVGPGNYLHGAVDAFNGLLEKYGAEFSVAS